MEDEVIDECFMQNVTASKDIVTKRQNARSVKEGEACLTGTIESYVVSVTDKNGVHNVNKLEPPPLEMRTARDGKKKYPAAITTNVRLEAITPIPDQVVERTDGKAGWRVRQQVNYFEEATKYFAKNRGLIWSVDCDEEHQRMQEFVTQTGDLITERWVSYSPGDMVKVKIGDTKDNVFRKDNPDKPGMKLVQPSTPVKFLKVEADVYINVVERTVSATDGARGDEANAAAAADTGAADTTTPAAGGDTKEGTRKIKVLQISPSFRAKATDISENYDANLAHTERLHELRDPNAHNMVPVECLRSKTMTAPRSAYFYVKKRRMTPWDPKTTDPKTRGVTIIRDEAPDQRDFMTEFQEVKYPTCVIRFNVWQWLAGDEKKNVRNRYVVTVRQKKGDELWRKFGITQLESYAFIVGANLELPLHIDAELWEGSVINHESNKPEVINNKPELVDIRGYYVYGLKDIVPDFLRFFRTSGTRVSAEFVSKEFLYWEGVNKLTQRTKIVLQPIDDSVENPVNVGKIMSPVLALGNGWFPGCDDGGKTPDAKPEVGLNHAFKGDIAPLFEGTHEFYVLTSYSNWTTDERLKWTGPNAPYADEFITALKKDHKIRYWIYAVRKDAKMSKTFAAGKIAEQTPANRTVPTSPAKTTTTTKEEKRDRSQQEAEASEGGEASQSVSEVSESEGGTKRTRRTRRVRN